MMKKQLESAYDRGGAGQHLLECLWTKVRTVRTDVVCGTVRIARCALSTLHFGARGNKWSALRWYSISIDRHIVLPYKKCQTESLVCLKYWSSSLHTWKARQFQVCILALWPKPELGRVSHTNWFEFCIAARLFPNWLDSNCRQLNNNMSEQRF